MLASAVIAGVRIADALIKTGSAFSMLSSAMYARLRDAPAIQPFTRAAPDVIGVGGASAEIRGYVDAPVEIVGVTVHHPVLVVEGFAFLLLIGQMFFERTAPSSRLPRKRQCGCAIASAPSAASSKPTCLLLHPLPPSPLALRAALSSSLARPHSFACELLTRFAKSSTTLPSPSRHCLKSLAAPRSFVHVPADSFFDLLIANPSNSRVEITAGTPVAALSPVALAPNSPTTAATSP